ncbi:hypothetical protein [Streptomyces sp. NPDC050504]|uniref:hypothetical protein n=1 Tax=Streptomyces sp. NPDC050504 TaxID=3365618 RepID=UPI0037B057F1
MRFDSLLAGNFGSLHETIAEWQQLLGKLDALRRQADDGMRAKAFKADWAGVNAAVTREFIAKTAGEFGDARTQATTICGILRDTHGELARFHEQLVAAVNRATAKDLAVRDTGDGGFTVTVRSAHPGQEAEGPHRAPEKGAHDVHELKAEIQRILNQAAESDDSAAEALRLVVDQAKYGFSEARYRDRDSAARAVRAAKEVAALVKKDPAAVTNTELARVNGMLAKYRNDPLFAEKFATDAGPRTILEFYAGVADPFGPTHDPARGEQAKQLQRNLGLVLGTATRSDSARMESWERKMVDLGAPRLGIAAAGGPHGFVVMSNLMRFGNYDDQFLNNYGDELVAYDKKHNVKDLNPWINNTSQGDLNFWGGNDRGRDPMTGFLQALGHNPDAATQFFSRPAGAEGPVSTADDLSENLTYLAKDRLWSPDAPPVGGDSRHVAGLDAFGHALEAATTGYAYDSSELTRTGTDAGGDTGGDTRSPGDPDRRTAATAGVMEQVAYLYGSPDGAKLLHGQPELGDSLGRIASAHIDDINWALSENDPDSMFANADHARFGRVNAAHFLSTLGQNPDAYAAISTAEKVYTASMLEAQVSADGKIDEGGARAAVKIGAEVHGTIDQARANQVEAEGLKKDADYNKAMEERAGWIQLGSGAAIAAGVAFLPAAPAVGLAATLVPLATDTGSAVAEELVNKAISGWSETSQEQHSNDLKEQVKEQRDRIYEHGKLTTDEPLKNFREKHGIRSEEIFGQDLGDSRDIGYSKGCDWEDRTGNPSETS